MSPAALLASLLITLLATNWLLRPLRRIEQTIDRIVQGNYPGATEARRPSRARPRNSRRWKAS